MTDDIRPALSAVKVDWRGRCYDDHGLQIRDESAGQVSLSTDHPGAQWRVVVPDGPQRHALAALCLYGQRFGFSRDDLKMLDSPEWEWDDTPERRDAYQWWFDSFRARISALLPPEAK
jgi:hypothetical protein